jgi:hypothetical protein
MPYVAETGTSFLSRICDDLSLIIDRKYWTELKSGLGAEKILHRKVLTKVRVGNVIEDAGVKAYEIGGLKGDQIGYKVCAQLAFHSRSSDKTFDAPPKKLEEKLSGDPQSQLENMFRRLHKENDKIPFVR